MRFTVPVACLCGCSFPAPGYGKLGFPPAKCPQCGEEIHIIDPLTISVIADRLLLRSQREIAEGDYTLSIICGAMAVECALTQLFLKWKRLEHLCSAGHQPSKEEERSYEQEYRKKSPGGFEKSADFVTTSLVGLKYDEFIANFGKRSTADLIKAGFPKYESHAKAEYIHRQLFIRRNRILHWGEVGYSKDDASASFGAAITAVSLLKVIDRERYLAMEREMRSSTQEPSLQTNRL